MRNWLIFLLAAACAHAPARPTPPPEVVAAATAGVTDPGLRDLLARHWDETLRESPTLATHLGDHRFDREVDDVSAAGLARWRAARRGYLAEARVLPADRLGAEDRTTLALFIDALEGELEVDDACLFETWSVSVETSPLKEWSRVPEQHIVRTAADGEALAARFRGIARNIDAEVANLRIGAARGRHATAEAVRRTIAMLDGELARPAREWGWVKTATRPHPGWTPADEEHLAAALAAEVDGSVRPALARYRDALAKEILPHARSVEGLVALPGGDRCYAALVRMHTTLRLAPADLHRLGEDEIARIDDRMATLGAKLFGTRALPEVLARLRGDPALRFATSDEVEARARQALAAAKAKIPQFFGILPRADCVVERIPDYEAPYTTIAYYNDANPDGSKPGTYKINVSAPTTRPRYEAAVLAYHESIPGHHLQIAIAQELAALPAFRRYGGFTAFVEGWALYTELLADEMGLYDTDLDRMGMLSYQAWRASRLVVDTGIHALGWSREQAVTYMLEHTALAENNIRNEVDRYIGTPGQALAYMVGELTILRLRGEAQAKLGRAFHIKAFHDAVLGAGSVTLGVLERRLHAWIEDRVPVGRPLTRRR